MGDPGQRERAKKLLCDVCACAAESECLDLPHVVKDCIEPIEAVIVERDILLHLHQHLMVMAQMRDHTARDFVDWMNSTQAAAGQLRALRERGGEQLPLEAELARLRALVYVPGVTKCAKCSLRLVSSVLDASSGRVGFDTSPQDCPNGCGPMWRVTERDASNELCDRLEAAQGAQQVAEARLGAALKALEGLKCTSCGGSGEYKQRGRGIVGGWVLVTCKVCAGSGQHPVARACLAEIDHG